MKISKYGRFFAAAGLLMASVGFAAAAAPVDTAKVEVAGGDWDGSSYLKNFASADAIDVGAVVAYTVIPRDPPSPPLRKQGEANAVDLDHGVASYPHTKRLPPIGDVAGWGVKPHQNPIPREAKWRPGRPYPSDSVEVAGGYMGHQGKMRMTRW